MFMSRLRQGIQRLHVATQGKAQGEPHHHPHSQEGPYPPRASPTSKEEIPWPTSQPEDEEIDIEKEIERYERMDRDRARLPPAARQEARISFRSASNSLCRRRGSCPSLYDAPSTSAGSWSSSPRLRGSIQASPSTQQGRREQGGTGESDDAFRFEASRKSIISFEASRSFRQELNGKQV